MTTLSGVGTVQRHSKYQYNQYNNYTTKKSGKTMQYDYTNTFQRARLDKGYTQEKASELTGKSVESVKAYESGRTRPSAETIQRMAEIYEAPYLYAEYLNQDEIISRLMPPIKANQSPEKAALRFMGTYKKIAPAIDELYNIASGGNVSNEFFELLGMIISDGLTLRFWQCD